MSAYRQNEGLQRVAATIRDPGKTMRNLAGVSGAASGIFLVAGGIAGMLGPAGVLGAAALFCAWKSRKPTFRYELYQGPGVLVLKGPEGEERIVLDGVTGFRTRAGSGKESPDRILSIYQGKAATIEFRRSELGEMFTILETELQKRCFL